MKLQRPVEFNNAIEFAITEFEKGSRFWPRLLVAYCEEKARGGALRFTLDVYELVAERRCNDYVNSRIDELRSLISSKDAVNPIAVRGTSREIWEDATDRSIEKRGTTRLYNALSHQIRNENDEYEAELARALGMVAVDEEGKPFHGGFEFVVNRFREAYQQ